MKNPLVKRFRLFGLHGYKNIEIDFQSAARIIIAENGTGKTTILSALYSFLKKDFYRLAKIKFVRLECLLAENNNNIVLNYEDIQGFASNSGLEELLKFTNYSMKEVLDAISNYEPSESYLSSPVLHDIYMRSPHDGEEFDTLILNIQKALPTMSERLSDVVMKIDSALGKREILYLPTYRRVELPSNKPLRKATSRRMRVETPSDGVRYGLRDVQDRLAEILTDIQRYSNGQYRAISASIIDDTLAGEIKPDLISETQLPDLETLRLFFSRVETEKSKNDRIESLRGLYESGAILKPDQLILRYFLSKLNNVVERTKQLEENVEKFVEQINLYLKMSSDEKTLTYDSDKMKVVVKNNFNGDEIDLDALSSGEKQVISLFSHLYLEPGQKIVLIDEPELSLSMDWQRRILPDVIAAPACDQLLAITHSPFIFENDLDPFAGPIKITRAEREKETV